ncbi:isopenicillin N synthase family oxygenase [Planktomarina sp.]|nr:2OG-Fe(II) oxygenase family protein [Planktomarina sp.]MDB4841174.1 isopenicillin N synthase family oxygenase [Planktomarina sp.]
MMKFPKFNLQKFEKSEGAQRLNLNVKLDNICRDTGFLVLDGHGVSHEIITAQWKVVSDFFALSNEKKQEVEVPYAGYPYGWIGPNKEALAASKGEKTLPDLKESFNGGPLTIPVGIKDARAYDFCYQPTIWPQIDGFKEAWCAYYREMENLAKRVMLAFAEALGLEPGFFDAYIKSPISALRALNYPATKEVAEEGQQRAGAHTDYGSLTILLPQPGTSGLQIHQNGNWLDVPAEENCFIVNLGDLMELWTSGRWVSTLHRVVAKPYRAQRKSLAFFHQPDWDAEISPIISSDGSSVISGPYLMNKFKSTNV